MTDPKTAGNQFCRATIIKTAADMEREMTAVDPVVLSSFKDLAIKVGLDPDRLTLDDYRELMLNDAVGSCAAAGVECAKSGKVGEDDHLLQVVSYATVLAHLLARTPKLSGVEMIRKHRTEQIHKHGYTTDADAAHTGGELVAGALCYLISALNVAADQTDEFAEDVSSRWPESLAGGYKRRDSLLENLVRAGAMIAAEIDRMVAAAVVESEAAES